MRGYSQAVSARLRAVTPGRHWSAWLEQTIERRRQLGAQRLEVIERLQREQREARRSGPISPNGRRLW
ncbi:MAG: hypothetical protein JO363_21940 [Solirubrobacterales bacterium]|nr:hypothetical protein [Solirubrobacterales bacterium]